VSACAIHAISGLGGCPRIVVVARGSYFEIDFNHSALAIQDGICPEWHLLKEHYSINSLLMPQKLSIRTRESRRLAKTAGFPPARE
jgi:hypothetical protein